MLIYAYYYYSWIENIEVSKTVWIMSVSITELIGQAISKQEVRLSLLFLRNVLFSPRCKCCLAPVQESCSGQVMWGSEGKAECWHGHARPAWTFTITMDCSFYSTDTLSIVTSRTGHTHFRSVLWNQCTSMSQRASFKNRLKCFPLFLPKYKVMFPFILCFKLEAWPLKLNNSLIKWAKTETESRQGPIKRHPFIF